MVIEATDSRLTQGDPLSLNREPRSPLRGSFSSWRHAGFEKKYAFNIWYTTVNVIPSVVDSSIRRKIRRLCERF